jgi:hypothetical protein
MDEGFKGGCCYGVIERGEVNGEKNRRQFLSAKDIR